jgi:hypothetical protein
VHEEVGCAVEMLVEEGVSQGFGNGDWRVDGGGKAIGDIGRVL